MSNNTTIINSPTFKGACKRSIAKAIHGAINEWFEKFGEVANLADDEERLLRNSMLVTGGCIASLLRGEPVNDYDVYFTNEEAVRVFVNALQRVIPEVRTDVEDFTNIKGETETRYNLLGNNKYALVESSAVAYYGKGRLVRCISPSAVSFEKVQIITRFYGEPEKIHSYFDFVHCTNYFLMNQNKLVLNEDALYSLLSKNLIYRGSLYPVCSILRLRKFLARGWTIDLPNSLKMILQTHAIDFSDRNTMKDQLISVDAAYLAEVFKEADGEETTFDVNEFLSQIEEIWNDLSNKGSME